jgi:threonine efflux protein
MDAPQLLPLVGALVMVEVVPGPSVVAVAVASMRDRRAGLWSAIGVSTGDMLWAIAALGGIGTLLEQSRPAFVVLRWLGAAYLLVAAVRLWGQRAVDVGASQHHGPRGPSFVTGLLVDLANPKAALLFTSLYVSVIPSGLDAWSVGTVLLTTAAVVYGWHLLVAVLLSRATTRRVHSPTLARQRVNRVSAISLGALGIRLALSS